MKYACQANFDKTYQFIRVISLIIETFTLNILDSLKLPYWILHIQIPVYIFFVFSGRKVPSINWNTSLIQRLPAHNLLNGLCWNVSKHNLCKNFMWNTSSSICYNCNNPICGFLYLTYKIFNRERKKNRYNSKHASLFPFLHSTYNQCFKSDSVNSLYKCIPVSYNIL